MTAVSALAPLLILVALVLAVVGLPERPDCELVAGTARVDITPPVEERPIPLNGYGERKKRPAEGVHDPLYAKALVLCDGRQKVAIASADLLWIGPELRARVVEKLTSEDLRSDNVLLFATHNHSGPSGLDRNVVYRYAFGEFDEELFEATTDRLAHVIDDANSDLKPAQIAAATREVPGLIRNRRGDGSVDASLVVVRIADSAGEPVAVLVNYGAHPTILGCENMLVSAGYPGALQAAMEESLGNGAIVLFSAGAEADQTAECESYGDRFACAQAYARELGDEARSLMAQMADGAPCSVRCMTSKVELPVPIVPENWRAIATDEFMRTLFPAESTLVTLVRLGDLLLIGMPGEIVASLGIGLKQRAAERGIKLAAIVGLANDYVGYMLTREQYLKGGYESHTASLYGEAFGKFMQTKAREAIDALVQCDGAA